MLFQNVKVGEVFEALENQTVWQKVSEVTARRVIPGMSEQMLSPETEVYTFNPKVTKLQTISTFVIGKDSAGDIRTLFPGSLQSEVNKLTNVKELPQDIVDSIYELAEDWYDEQNQLIEQIKEVDNDLCDVSEQLEQAEKDVRELSERKDKLETKIQDLIDNARTQGVNIDDLMDDISYSE